MNKTKDVYLKNIEDLPSIEIAKGIRMNIVTFEECQNTGMFAASKQRQVREILAKFKEEDDAYIAAQNSIDLLKTFLISFPNSELCENVRKLIKELKKKEERDAYHAANTLPLLKTFLIDFPESELCEKVRERIKEKEEEIKSDQQRIFDEIKKNINEYRPDEILSLLGNDFLRNLCKDLGIDYNFVANYDEPPLNFNAIPQKAEDIPIGYTDVLFWGIPSSGKTCALAVILRTIKDKYVMTSPSIPVKYGATYRDSLVNIFRNKTGYLPAATQKRQDAIYAFFAKKKRKRRRI